MSDHDVTGTGARRGMQVYPLERVLGPDWGFRAGDGSVVVEDHPPSRWSLARGWLRSYGALTALALAGLVGWFAVYRQAYSPMSVLVVGIAFVAVVLVGGLATFECIARSGGRRRIARCSVPSDVQRHLGIEHPNGLDTPTNFLVALPDGAGLGVLLFGGIHQCRHRRVRVDIVCDREGRVRALTFVTGDGSSTVAGKGRRLPLPSEG